MLLAGMAAVQQESTATHLDAGGPAGTREDGDLRGWTRVDLLPPDGMQEVSGSSPLSSTWSEAKFERIEQAVQQESTATAAEWAAVRVFGSGVFLRARLLAGQRIPDADPALPACHLRKSPCHRSRDSCRRVTTGSPEGPFLPATVAAFASSPAALAILVVRIYSQQPRLLARAARSLTARSARGLRCVAPMVSLWRWARWGAALFRRRDAPWRSPARHPRNQARDAAQRT